MKTIRALGGLTLATFLFGLVQPGMTQSYGKWGAATGTHSSVIRSQERTTAAGSFQGRAEYPPPGYLAEFEEGRGVRAARAERESAGEFAPFSPGGFPGSASRNAPGPEFAPGGYDLHTPSPQSGVRGSAAHGEQRWSSRAGPPIHEPSWPNAPSARFPTRPEFASDNLEPGRHEPMPGPRGAAPAYPPQNPGWPY